MVATIRIGAEETYTAGLLRCRDVMVATIRIGAEETYEAGLLRCRDVMVATIRIGAKGDLTGSFATLVRNTTW